MPSADPGTLSYFDIPVADAAKAHTFWGGLFGWRPVPGNFPGYEMLPEARPQAGLDATGGVGSIRVYFQVANLDDAVRRVRELGGTADEPVHIPSGRFAECVDDQGVPFRLWED
jgi:hypothetical protein